MSAYSKISLISEKQGDQFSPSAEAPIHASEDYPYPTLPKIEGEIEKFVSIAKSIELALIQERSLTRRYRQELWDLQNQFSKYADEVKIQTKTQEESHKKLGEALKEAERLKEEKGKLDIELDIARTGMEKLRRQGESVRSELAGYEFEKKSVLDQLQAMRQELSETRARLQKYELAWVRVQKLEAHAKSTLERAQLLERKLAETQEDLTREKRIRNHCDETLEKERREKKIALNCLHNAETQLANITREMDDLRRRKARLQI